MRFFDYFHRAFSNDVVTLVVGSEPEVVGTCLFGLEEVGDVERLSGMNGNLGLALGIDFLLCLACEEIDGLEVLLAFVTEGDFDFLFLSDDTCAREDDGIDYYALIGGNGPLEAQENLVSAIDYGLDVLCLEVVFSLPLLAFGWFACRRELVDAFRKMPCNLEGLRGCRVVC